MLTKTNAHEVKAACELVRSLGVKNSLSICPALNIGRGHNSDCSIISNMIIDQEYVALFDDLEKNYLDVLIKVYKINDESPYFLKDEQKNCGAGWKMAGISADGNVKACHLLGENAFIGNIYTNDFKSIFSSEKTVNFFQKFQKDFDDKRCYGCSFVGHCAKCIFKVFEANKQLLAAGKDLCLVAKENKMDLYFKFK
jgi:radical SAM protein with 4Fe4S-binding SPASM domain